MRAWAAIFETSNTVQYAADRELRASVGLTLAQFEILARVKQGPDAARRMTDIADELTVSRSGLTYQVGQLVREMLFDRISTTDLDTVTEILGAVRTQLRTRPKRSTFRQPRRPRRFRS